VSEFVYLQQLKIYPSVSRLLPPTSYSKSRIQQHTGNTVLESMLLSAFLQYFPVNHSDQNKPVIDIFNAMQKKQTDYSEPPSKSTAF
jgi:hypothetical protein